MYISYGWPIVLETTTAEGPSTSDSKAKDLDDSEEVAFVCSVGKATAIGKQNEVQVWTRTKQGRVRVGRFRAKDDDVMVEGGFRYAAWEPKQRALVVCTSGGVVYVLSLSEDARRDATGGSCPGSRFPAVDVGVRARFDCSGVLPTALLVDEKTILLGCADGALVSYNWDGYQKSKLSLLPPGEDLDAHEPWLNNQSVQTLQYCRSRRTLLILLKNGMCALYMFSSDGLRLKSSSSSFCWVLAPRSETITAASLSPESHTLALGTQCGAVHLYAIGNDLSQHKLRTLSLAEWGHTGQSSGVVESVRWTADGRAMAIVWEKAGLSVWTASGCRLMYHLEGHTGQKKEATAAAAGRRAVCWSPEGLQLVASSRRDPSRVLLFSFARAALNSSPTRSGTNQSSLLSVPSACLLGDDRVLCVFGSDVLGDAERPTLHHLPLPQQYSGLNWPARLIAVSARGEDLAVAGERGAALYSHRHRRWRLFGDVNQESAIRCLSLTWVDEVVMLCCQPCSSRPALLEDSSPQGQVQLRFYPKYHLDSTSLLCQKRLNAPPRAMSAQGDRLVVLSGDAGKLEAAVLRLIVEGPLGPSQRPIARVEVLREVCIVTMRPPPVLTSFVPALGGGDAGRGPRSACLVLHADGQLCHLDLETGSERGVLDKVEHFWCEAEPEGGRDGGSGDGSLLWTYGARGISILDVGRVLSLVREGKMARLEVQEPDPELEFDREVYPLGLNPGVNSIVGISQHSANLASSASHGFSPLPKAQPLLSPLLRYLLTQGRQEDAERLVQRSARHPHFSHSLEWLVFTVLEKEYSSADAVHAAAKPRGLYNLSTVLGLVQRLKVYADVIVRVARKIDPVHWGLLFQEAGQPTRLFEKSLQSRAYATAAGFLVIVETLEGPDSGQECALNLLQETLQEGEYDLTGELVRFLVRSARDMRANAEDQGGDAGGGSWFGMIFGSLTPLSSASQREGLLSKAVHKFLSAHAAALIASRRLQDLATFVHKSGFDVVPLLREEKHGVCRLVSFRQAVREIEEAFAQEGAKQLISLADSELLLEAFRAAGLTEWVIVLATVLRRSPLLLNLFRDDRALWSVFLNSLAEDESYTAFLRELERGMAAG